MSEPIFVTGAGRSGSTVFHDLICTHPQASWLSQLSVRFPTRPHWNAWALSGLDVPVAGWLVRRILAPKEAYRFWDECYRGFSSPFRDLDAHDVTRLSKERTRNLLARSTGRSRPQMIVKLTGWPRAGFIREIFPNAKFIHIYRDGRAVAESGMKVPWSSFFRGPDNWSWGELTDDQRARWERANRSFIVLSGLLWEKIMNLHEQAKAQVGPECFIELKYEELCRDPVQSFRLVCEFAGLEWSRRFETRVKHYGLRPHNDKWRRALTELQQRTLTESIEATLEKYGYDC